MKAMVNFSMMIFCFTVPVCRRGMERSKLNSDAMELPELNYPLSVERFYRDNRCKPIWVGAQTSNSKAWLAILLLDCVLQYGLSHADYHPERLSPSKIRRIFSNGKDIDPSEITAFDIYLTDAMITMINDLHFGKANPNWSRSRIDKEVFTEFDALIILKNALSSTEFLGSIFNVQPTSDDYRDLQQYMMMIRGQYLNDCYTVPESQARKVAINMERAKWYIPMAGDYIEVNLPSYLLTYHSKDIIYTFKVAIGKKDRSTPEMKSSITYLNTAPDWKVPHSVIKSQIVPQAYSTKTSMSVTFNLRKCSITT